MADAIEQRDFFISFNSADLAYAEAIDAALREAGFSTFFHPNDLPDGGNIIIWMDEALMNSAQTLALFSPDYTKDKAVYSKIERYASLWQDPGSDERKLIPILLREATFTPLIAPLKRIDITSMSRQDAAAHVVNRLKTAPETKERNRSRVGHPLPKVFNVLYRRNPNFTGRLEDMESLQKLLREGNAAISAVAGLGGVGKTTLAAEYCHRFGGRYGGVWWVRAEQESVMLADLATLGQRLGLVATGNIEADARSALENIASRTEPWLMVYDNAPNADAVAKWLPVGSVRCLITSRFAAFDSVATVTPLDQWPDEVTADYLLARTGRNDKEGALRLGHSLGGLPLAAEQAAVFLKDRKGISFDDYAKEIARLIKEEKPAGSKGDYPDTVYAAFVKSLETLEGMKGGKSALDILRLCSFLSPDGVDLTLLQIDEDAKILPTKFAKAMADPFLREDALAVLAALSLLREEAGPLGTILIFHRLLLDVGRDWMGVNARALWGTRAVRLVNQAFPYDTVDDPSKWFLCARLTSHVASLEAHAPRADKAGRALSRLLNQASTYLRGRGDLSGALTMAEKSLALVRATGLGQLQVTPILINLAGVYTDLDRLDESEATFREALPIMEQYLDPNNPSLASAFSNFARVHWQRGRFEEAEQLLLRVAKIDETSHGSTSPEYAKSLANLGAVYSDWAEEPSKEALRERAKEYEAQALAVTRAARGTRHPSTAQLHKNVAVTFAKRGDFANAAREAEYSVAIMMSLGLHESHLTEDYASHLIYFWRESGLSQKATRLSSGDISDLLQIVAQIEAEHNAWVAEDPKNRDFGPPSPFGPS